MVALNAKDITFVYVVTVKIGKEGGYTRSALNVVGPVKP